MKFILSLLVLQLISCAHQVEKPQVTLSSQQVKWEKMWIQNGCTLYNFKRELKVYPGALCIFLDDGSFLSASDTSLKRFSPTRGILWEVPGHFHHQLNLTPDKKRVLALSSSVSPRNGKNVRHDAFLIFDLDGKLLHRAESPALLKEAGRDPLLWRIEYPLQSLKADFESSHFNSFYEIPENVYSNSVPWMKKGNFILNSAGLGIFILSSDLSQLHKFFKLQSYGTRQAHDVQAGADGKLLFFNNHTDSPDNVRFSTVQKFDPVIGKIENLFKANPRELFYSPAQGGVQELGDLIFFSHVTSGGFLWSPSRNEIVIAVPGTNADPTDLIPTQQLKLVDVEDFFKNSK